MLIIPHPAREGNGEDTEAHTKFAEMFRRKFSANLVREAPISV